jgi:glycosyltransferase involved in cell wall biosynthesis
MSASGDMISVIIPVFNRRRDALRAIASALAQTLPPDEIVIVDDASSDDSVAAITALGEPRIRILRHAHNRGASAARNTGIDAAQGNWIAFLDSDDEWVPEKLARQMTQLAETGTEAGVTGYVIRDYRTGEERDFRPTDHDASLDALVWGCPLGVGSTLLARKRVFAEVGLLDPDLPRLEDWEWLMRYLPVHKLAVLPDPLTIVHKAGDPTGKMVTTATARIRAQHRAGWYRRSFLAGRKFDSTLLVEEAAAAYYGRDTVRAATLSLRALAAYPLRGGLLSLMTRRTLKRLLPG